MSDTRLVAPPTRRRLLVSFAIFVSLAFAAILGLGVAAVNSNGDAPANLVIPAPRVGDRGVYTITTLRAGEVLEAEETLLEFEILADGNAQGLDGFNHRAHRMDVINHRGTTSNGLPVRETLAYGAGQTLLSVAMEYNATSSLGSPGQPSPAVLPATFHSEGVGMQVDYDTEQRIMLCGPQNRLQGQSTDITGDVELFSACDYVDYWSPSMAFRARGTEIVDGHDAVVFARTGGGSGVFVWMSADVAYPLRMSVEDQDHPGQFLFIRLAAFAPGSGPALGAIEDNEARPLPALVWSPRPAWGLDETGVHHPFSLATAYQHALADGQSGLAAWLDGHAGGYLAGASYSEKSSDGSSDREWSMFFGDGATNHDLRLAQVIQPRVDQLGLVPNVLPESAGAYETTYEYRETGASEVRRPTLAGLPADSPTVQSLFARWSMHASAGMAAEQPNSWGFAYGCQDDACQDVVLGTSAGLTRFDETGGDVTQFVTQAYSVDWRTSLLQEGFAQDGSTTSKQLGELWLGGNRAPDILDAAPWSGSIPPAAPAGLAVSPWTMPTGLWVAGAGLVSLVSAALYAAWPALKGAGGVGLFSRLSGQQLLEHPVRRTVHQAIEANPGIHLKELVRVVGRPRNTVEHHARKLVAGGLVSMHTVNGYACLFAKGQVDRFSQAAAPFLKAPGARRLLVEVTRTPGRGLRDVARAAGISPAAASYHVNRLEKAGLVAIARGESGLRLQATALGQKAAA